MEQWPGARCSADFCVVALERDGRAWQVLMSRSREIVAKRALAAACERADIVVSERWPPHSCRPRWIRADGRFFAESGGLAIVLAGERVARVADSQGEHGWWQGYVPR